MRMFHIAVFIICINFSLVIVRGLGIFQNVPTAEAAPVYATYTPSSVALGLSMILGGAVTAAIAGLAGYRLPAGAVVFATVFGVSAIPLSGTLETLNSTISGWPTGLNMAILGLVGFVFFYVLIQLASVGGKVLE